MKLHYDLSKPQPCDTCIHSTGPQNGWEPRCAYMKDGFMGSKEIGDGVDYCVHNAFMFIVFRRFPARPEYNVVRCFKYQKTRAARNREYYESDEWKKKRRQKLKASGYTCELCGSAINLQVHHISYSHFGAEPLEDLIVLCAKCHKTLHCKDLQRKDLQGGVAG